MHLLGFHTLAVTLMQSVPVEAFATWDSALKAIGGAALGFSVRQQFKQRDELKSVRDELLREVQSVSKDLAALRVFLIGIDGTNGLRGDVKLLMRERDDALKDAAQPKPRHSHARKDD
jgi:hypothetical protein